MLTSFGLIAGGMVALFLAIWLYLSYRKTKNILVGYMAAFFWLKVGFFIFLILGTLTPLNVTLKAYFLAIGTGIVHFTLIPLAMFASYLWFPKLKKLAIGVFAVGAITTFIITLNSLTVLPEVNLLTMGKVVGQFDYFYILFSHLIGMAAVGMAILFKGIKSPDKKVVLRSVLLGLGMAGAALSGSAHFWAANETQLIIFGTTVTIAHIMMGVGVVIRPSRD